MSGGAHTHEQADIPGLVGDLGDLKSWVEGLRNQNLDARLKLLEGGTPPPPPPPPPVPVGDPYLDPFPGGDGAWRSRVPTISAAGRSGPMVDNLRSLALGFNGYWGNSYNNPIFDGKDGDGARSVYATDNAKAYAVPHWPADAKSATGDDGYLHVTQSDGTVWDLSRTAPRGALNPTSAARVNHFDLRGDGFTPMPGSTQDRGSRAIGCSPYAGVIRGGHFARGYFGGVLIISLAPSQLAKSHAFVWPARSIDGNPSDYAGLVPPGARVCLPPEFDVNACRTAPGRMLARAFKDVGAFVGDSSGGMNLYCSNEATSLMGQAEDAGDLETIRRALCLAGV